MGKTGFRRAIQRITALGEPQRMLLFELVSQASEPVSRDQAAEAAGLKRGITSFHLDKLVEDGLLEVEFRRLNDRSGPGAGRPAKLYKRSQVEVQLSTPERHYDTAAQLLADGIARAGRDRTKVEEGVSAAARDFGFDLVDGLKATEAPVTLSEVCELFEQHGYEPAEEGGEVVLRNCPFHRLAARHQDLVCGMNLAIFEAVDDRLSEVNLNPRLQPEPGYCCVRFSGS